MLEQIKQLVEQVSSKEMSSAGISSDLLSSITQETGNSVVTGLKEAVSSGNIQGLTSLLGDNTLSTITNNPIVGGIIGNLSSSLVEKIGLNSGTAEGFAGSVIPKLIEMISSKASNGEQGFQVTDLISNLGGNDGVGGVIGGILGGNDSIGGALGKLKGLF